MFEALSDRLSGVLTRLTAKGALSEEDVQTALRVRPLVQPADDVKFQKPELAIGDDEKVPAAARRIE